MNERQEALFIYCQNNYNDETVTKHDIVPVLDEYGYWTSQNTFDTPYGQFTILNDDEASEVFVEDTKNLIEELGIEIFSPSYYNNIYQLIDEESKEQLLEEIKEFATSYMEDIAYESGDETELTRQQEEIIEFLYQNREIDFDVEDVKQYEEDVKQCSKADEIADFIENYDNKVEDYIEEYAENYAEEYRDNPIEYLQFNFGNEYIDELIKNGSIKLDYRAIAEEIETVDGRGSLASYDGQEQEVKINDDYYYIYCQDDKCIEKTVDMIENMYFENEDAEIIMELLDSGVVTREMLEDKDLDNIIDCLEDYKEENGIEID